MREVGLEKKDHVLSCTVPFDPFTESPCVCFQMNIMTATYRRTEIPTWGGLNVDNRELCLLS